ncbi:hypothetical protein GCM10007977_083860 [Dactylosporangium sucinum]|uniref:Uncharacterized protein n=2 Tax=Dactylosporangium sucinum TaxID=1424081 RepID=A0A917UCK4_9ACTN|nr:hypothetical protein GCM10007977_083860 [Dactylosporangium sucinum]
MALVTGAVMLAFDLAVQFQAHVGSWHLVALAPLERLSRAALIFAAGLVLLAAASWRVSDGKVVARVLTVFAGVLAPFAVIAAAAANVVETGILERSSAHQVAVTPDGRHALYARSVYSLRYDDTCYRLRTTGWLVRESRVDVVCVDGVQVEFADDSHLRVGTRTIAFSGVATAETVYMRNSD